jgi:hypothetical protein
MSIRSKVRKEPLRQNIDAILKMKSQCYREVAVAYKAIECIPSS